jgi:hypothetical protein
MDSQKHDYSETERTRRPYTPPAVEETGDFERLILGCLHLPMQNSTCDEGPPEGGSS